MVNATSPASNSWLKDLTSALKHRLRRGLSDAISTQQDLRGPTLEALEPRIVLAAPIQFHIANNMGTEGFKSTELYVSMYGLVVGRGNVPFVISKDGHAVPGNTAHNGNAPSIKLSDLKNGDILVDSALSIEGGRFYISNSPSTITISAGNINGPTTSSSKTYFDFVEFALNAPGTTHQLVVDTSQVDAVGFPITLTVAPPDPSFTSSGISIDRANLFSKFRAQVPNASDYIFSSGEDYRILSPAQAITTVLPAQTLLTSITSPTKVGSNFTANITLPNNTTASLKVGMVVSGPWLPNHVTIDKIVDAHTITVKSDMAAFTAKSSLYLNFYNNPSSSLVHYFDKSIDTFFNFYTKDNPLVLSSVGNIEYRGYTQKVSHTNINGTTSDYAALRMVAQDGSNLYYDIYYPFFSTNTPSGKTPHANGLTPIGTVPPPPPSFWAYSPTPKPQMTMYEPPSQMVFAGNGVFADDAFQFPGNSARAQVQGNLENQIVVALNRGYATAFNTRKGTVTGTSPFSDKATVHLTSGTTDGIVAGMYFSTFPLGEMMKVVSVDKAAGNIHVQALTKSSILRPINESVMHFTTFFPSAGTSNAYAQFLHSNGIAIGQRAYALSYDDQGGYSTTLTSNYGSTPTKVVVNLVSWSKSTKLNNAPMVGGLFSNQLDYHPGESITLSALDVTDPDTTVSSVSFYYDKNNNGTIDEGDTALGEGVSSESGTDWSLTVPATTFELGENQILAQAKDDEGLVSTTAVSSFDLTRSSVGAGVPTNKTQYVDAQGNKVTVSLTGPGTIEAHFDEAGNDDPTLIEVFGAVAGKSTLNFTVLRDSKVVTSTGITSIGQLSVHGGLVSINATKVNVTDSLFVEGAVGTVNVNDFIGNEQVIALGGAASNKTALNLGRLHNVSLSTGATVSSFKAVEWIDDNDIPDQLTAYSLGSLTITGRAATLGVPAISGSFQADLALTQEFIAKSVPAVSSISVAGAASGLWNLGVHKLNSATIKGVTSGEWSNQSGFGSLNLMGNVSDFLLTSTKDITSINIKGSADDFRISTLANLGTVNIAQALVSSLWNVSGKSGAITLGSTSSSRIDISGDLLSFTVKGQAANLQLHNDRNIGAVKVAQWSQGSLSADKVASLTATGATAIPGDFSADVTITAQGVAANANALGSASIAATLANSKWSIAGKVGPVNVGALDTTDITAQGPVSSFTAKFDVTSSHLISQDNIGPINISGRALSLTVTSAADISTVNIKGEALDTGVSAEGNINTVTAGDWLGGFITADKINSITTRGVPATKTHDAINGDFTGKLTVTGQGVAANANALGSVSISGQLHANTWSIAGRAGTLTFGSTNNSTLNISGHLTAFVTKGSVQQTSIVADKTIGSITSQRWLSGSIIADMVTSITTKGQANTLSSAAIPGDFTGTVTLSGQGVGSNQNVLGSANIAGTMVNALWRISGNSGAISVGAIDGSSIFLGVDPSIDPAGLPTTRPQFINPDATLAGFTVTGKALASPNTTPSFTNSRIAAGILTKASLKLVDLAGSHENGFAIATKIVAYARQDGPLASNLFKVANQTAPGIYDPESGAITGYRLQIVPFA